MNKKEFIEDPYNEYDPNLDSDEKNNPNPFPEKMARAIAFIEKNGLPPEVKQVKKRKKSLLTPLQAELLNYFAHNPTEKQLLQLKDFLNQLLKEESYSVEVRHEAVTA